MAKLDPQACFVPQAAPGLRAARHRDEIAAAIARVVAEGRYVLGAECEAFEHEFARFLDALFAIGVNSGTDALKSPPCWRSASRQGTK